MDRGHHASDRLSTEIHFLKGYTVAMTLLGMCDRWSCKVVLGCDGEVCVVVQRVLVIVVGAASPSQVVSASSCGDWCCIVESFSAVVEQLFGKPGARVPS